MYTPHEVRDAALLDALTESMCIDGWIGAPLVGDMRSGQLFTGSHRYAAARAAGIEAEIIDVRDVFDEAGLNYDTLIAEITGGEYGDGGYYAEMSNCAEAVRELPAALRDYYGLDLH